ncbi:MAG: lysine--tRNA ligase [Candidatus Moraniibacteriota bacterium]
MFWADRVVSEIKQKYQQKIASGEPLVIRDEKTASGRVHIGSMRGVAIHGAVAEILATEGISTRFLYEINDFDPMDGLPVYLDEKIFRPHMGKPLCNVPSPDSEAKNFAEYFGNEFKAVIERAGFAPEFYLSSEVYKAGKYNEVIRIALENAAKIREIYKKVSGAVKPEDWMPLHVVCEHCGKLGTTKVISFDGDLVEYVCEPHLVKWAEGCGHRGKISPFDGNAKFPWKVEWAAKFRVFNVSVEGAGKDHSTRGGARDIANHIAREVFGYEPPFDIPYEFFLVDGKKMSSSKGAGSSSKEISDLLPPQLFRFLLLSKDPKRVIDFLPDGDTIPLLYDLYDKYAESFFAGQDDDYARAFLLAHASQKQSDIVKRFFPRFSLVAFLVQMPHMDFESEIKKLKGGDLSEADLAEAQERAHYAKHWLEGYAPESYRYTLQTETVPESAQHFSAEQKKALRLVLNFIQNKETLSGEELHAELHGLKEQSSLPPKEFFGALYLSFLGKESGPKAGWFLSVLPKAFLEQRLQEVTKEE